MAGLVVKETSTKLGTGGPYGTSFPTVKGGLNFANEYTAGTQINKGLQRQAQKKLRSSGSRRFAPTPVVRTITN